jgi:hypothetical protein|tara:strand:- start:385 stop:1047 length:663 start_codon:yes stop_codon:yes gene_type:complete
MKLKSILQMRKIDNFFTKQGCDWYKWYHSVLPETRDNGQRLLTMTHYAQPFFAKKLKQLQEHLPQNEEITTVNINFDYSAGGIHSDGYIELDKDDKIAKSYLIPISVDAIDKYYTIIFDQTSHRAVTFNSALGLGSKGITTYKQVTREEYGLSDTPFDKKVYEKYLTHLDYNALRGLTVDYIHEWKLGDAMIWPRENFHVSANFTNKNARASVLITTRYT